MIPCQFTDHLLVLKVESRCKEILKGMILESVDFLQISILKH